MFCFYEVIYVFFVRYAILKKYYENILVYRIIFDRYLLKNVLIITRIIKLIDYNYYKTNKKCFVLVLHQQ